MLDNKLPLKSNEDELIELSEKRMEFAYKYAEARMKYAKTMADLQLILSTKIRAYMEEKKNIGIDMAMLRLLNESGEGIRSDYKEMEKAQAAYKGLELIIDAIAAKQSNIQSIMKNNRINDN